MNKELIAAFLVVAGIALVTYGLMLLNPAALFVWAGVVLMSTARAVANGGN